MDPVLLQINMMNLLQLTTSVSLNSITAKDSFDNLHGVTQSSQSILPGASYTTAGGAKVLYLKTDKPVSVSSTNSTSTLTLQVNSTLLLTDSYTSITVTNSSTEETATIFLVVA